MKCVWLPSYVAQWSWGWYSKNHITCSVENRYTIRQQQGVISIKLCLYCTVSVFVNFWSIFQHKNRTKFPKNLHCACYEPHSWPKPRLGIPLSNLKHYLHTIRIDWYRFVLMFQLETFKGHYHVSLLRHLVLFYGVLLENSKAHLKIIVD